MKFKIGDTAIVTQESRHYTGRYAGTDVEIVSITGPSYCTVEAYDKKKFMCPIQYLVTADEFYKTLPVPTCECGSKHTSMPNVHLTYCDLFKEKQ